MEKLFTHLNKNWNLLRNYRETCLIYSMNTVHQCQNDQQRIVLPTCAIRVTVVIRIMRRDVII